MKRITALILGMFTALTIGLTALPAHSVLALNSKQAVCEGINNCVNNSGVDIGAVVRTIINILSVVVGLASVIMIIVAGLKYVTSGGDSSSISNAKTTLIYAIVGLIIAAMAQFIVRFVLVSVK
jgi:hypothetical protein